LVASARAEEVPTIAGTVEKDGDPTVGFAPRGSDETYARRSHPPIGSIEVVDAKEEGHPARGLGPDDRRLTFVVRTGQQDPRSRPRWSHNDPAFGLSLFGVGWRILDEIKAQSVDEELDCGVVLVYDEGDQVEVHRWSLRAGPSNFTSESSRNGLGYA
jgi:hypothetical protein